MVQSGCLAGDFVAKVSVEGHPTPLATLILFNFCLITFLLSKKIIFYPIFYSVVA